MAGRGSIYLAVNKKIRSCYSSDSNSNSLRNHRLGSATQTLKGNPHKPSVVPTFWSQPPRINGLRCFLARIDEVGLAGILLEGGRLLLMARRFVGIDILTQQLPVGYSTRKGVPERLASFGDYLQVTGHYKSCLNHDLS